MSGSLIDLKRDYLKRVVETLKSRGVLQKDLAAMMQESDATLSGRLSGSRGIPDDFIDRVQEKTGLPFTVGGGVEGITADLLQRFVAQSETNTNLLNLALSEIREMKAAKQGKHP